MTQSTNPLARHFRQPALYIELTSKGQFWRDDALELTSTGEIAIYPMTAKDEITLRTPDALISGASVVQVIQSCCPNIKDAWDMPSVDVDSTLIAIRIASYGPKMEIKAKCPHCNEEHEYDIDLQHVLSKIKMPDYAQTFSSPDGMIIQFKPLNYRQISKIGATTFAEQKMIQSLTDPDIPDDVRTAEYAKHLNTMTDLNITNYANLTRSITTADGVAVNDPRHIKEFYQNCAADVIRHVDKILKSFSDVVSIKNESVQCSECNKPFDINVEFDYSHFFDRGF